MRFFASRERDLRKHLSVLIARQGRRCGLCRERLPRRTGGRRVHVDHIVPRKEGGSDDLANLQAVHALCNRIKGGRGEIRAVRRCDHCDEWYGSKRHRAREYCSDRCREEAHRARQGCLGCSWFILGLVLGALTLLAAMGLSRERLRPNGDRS